MELNVTETNEALEDIFKKVFENPAFQFWLLCNMTVSLLKLLKEVIYVPPTND